MAHQKDCGMRKVVEVTLTYSEIFRRVGMSSAYGAVRGVWKDGEEVLPQDRELLEVYFRSATAAAAVSLSGYDVTFESDGDGVSCRIHLAGDDPGGGEELAGVVGVIMADYYTEYVCCCWLSLLRGQRLETAPLAERFAGEVRSVCEPVPVSRSGDAVRVRRRLSPW